MDTKLAASLEDLEKLFGSRMRDYEAKLHKATTSSTSSPDIASISCEFSEFKAFVCQALTSLKTQIELLAAGFDRHETVMRRKVLLLHGVPEKENEKLSDVVRTLLSNQMKLTEVCKDSNVIHVCHRLGFSKLKTRPILVRFFRMEHRQLVWESKKVLKGTGVTISEFLTQVRHRIFTAARKHFGMSNCWSMEGKIVVICPDKSRRKFETASELHDLIAKFPCSADTGVSAHSKVPGSSEVTSLTTTATAAKKLKQTRLRK